MYETTTSIKLISGRRRAPVTTIEDFCFESPEKVYTSSVNRIASLVYLEKIRPVSIILGSYPTSDVPMTSAQ
jgi:hypothetical protein